MSDVSCKALDGWFQEAKKRKVPPEVLAQGLPYSLKHLKNKHERIDWASFARFVKNSRTFMSEDDLVHMGGAFLRSPVVRSHALLARFLFSAKDFYRWTSTKKANEGVGNQLFSCIDFDYQDLGSRTVKVRARLLDGYGPLCPDVFLVSKGVYI